MIDYISYSLLTAAAYALPALGLCLAISVVKYFNLAYADYLAFGAYIALFFNMTLGWNIFFAALVAMLFSGILGVIFHKAVFKPLMDRKVDPLGLLVTSLGLGFIIRNIILIIWGPQPYQFNVPLMRMRYYGPFHVTWLQGLFIIIALGVTIGIFLMLKFTKLGQLMRAVADNVELAKVRGIEPESVYMWTWFIATALAALGGVFMAQLGTLSTHMGIGALVTIFACLIIGGIENPYGALVGALIVGFVAEATATLWRAPYKIAAAYLLMIIILLIKPTGLFGRGGKGIAWGSLLKTFTSLLRPKSAQE